MTAVAKRLTADSSRFGRLNDGVGVSRRAAGIPEGSRWMEISHIGRGVGEGRLGDNRRRFLSTGDRLRFRGGRGIIDNRVVDRRNPELQPRQKQQQENGLTEGETEFVA